MPITSKKKKESESDFRKFNCQIVGYFYSLFIHFFSQFICLFIVPILHGKFEQIYICCTFIYSFLIYFNFVVNLFFFHLFSFELTGKLYNQKSRECTLCEEKKKKNKKKSFLGQKSHFHGLGLECILPVSSSSSFSWCNRARILYLYKLAFNSKTVR